jgi:cobalamin biosynthetic protein CobC
VHRRLEQSADKPLGASTAEPPPETIAHGGDLDRARRIYPGAPEPWLDLSTGINPAPYPVNMIAPEAWSRLPQTDALAELLAAAARCYAAPEPEMLVAAPGTQALIGLLPHLIERTRVAILGPAYAEHETSWRRAGHSVDVIRHAADAQDAGVVVAVNPDNPTGRLLLVDTLLRLAATLRERGGLLVVDEAFADLLPRSASLVPQLPPNAIVLRSFGKTYGLAGLRLGFAIAHAPLAQQLQAALGPWPVSGPAITIGTRALADDAWLVAARTRLEHDCARLDPLLANAGCDLVGGTPLFRLVQTPRAPGLASALGRRGILVRTFDYEPTWLRIGLPGAAADWERLQCALAAASTEL